MHFALRHLMDFCCVLGAMAFFTDMLRKKSTNRRSFICYYVAAMLLFVGGLFGLLHGFPKLVFVAQHHYLIDYYARFLEQVGLGMALAWVMLRGYLDFESP